MKDLRSRAVALNKSAMAGDIVWFATRSSSPSVFSMSGC
jgi:hypothetical protein